MRQSAAGIPPDGCMNPKELIARYMPDADKIREHKHLRLFGPRLLDSALWHLNRHSVAKAFMMGLMCAFIPVPFQMVLAAAGAILVRGNLPIAVALVWLTNPLTMPPIFYMCYKLGSWVSGVESQDISLDLDVEALAAQLSMIWEPFILGCAIMGISAAFVGYFGIHVMWRLMVSLRWKSRNQPKAGTEAE